MRKLLAVAFAFGAASLVAAPVLKLDPVAEGFPAWQGVTAKNYIMGREICPSDLRHKVTVVIEVEPPQEAEKFQPILLKAADVVGLDPLTANAFGDNWETRVLPRDMIVVLSVRNAGKDILATFKTALKAPKDADENVHRQLGLIRSPSLAVYSDVTFEGAPDTAGKRPYVYVLGPTGKEIVGECALDEKALKTVRAAVGKAKKKLKESNATWEPFFGTLAEENRSPALLKALAKGKTAKTSPLAPVAKALLKDVESKDEEKSKNAQIAYDALEQTRSDLLMRIKMEFRECPHRAAFDLQYLLKYWPGEKKRLDLVAAKLKENPEAAKLAQIYCKIMVWADPEFTCKNAGEANKIVKELSMKIKKDLEKLKESKVIVVQNGALLLDAQVDELIAVIPSKLPAK